MSGRTGNLAGLFANAYAGRRVLITGHTGFKGSWLALWLQMMGAQVYGLALPPENGPGHVHLLGLDLQEALIDLRDADKVGSWVRQVRPEVIFHLAAQPLVRRSYRAAPETFDTNVMGLVNLLEAVRATASVRAVVNATTDKCYANREMAAGYRESDPLGGRDPYSASKACAEIVTASYRDSFFAQDDGRGHAVGLATARAGNVIGGADWAEDRLVPDLVRAAIDGRAVDIRHPQATRPWQHVLEPLAGYLTLGQRLLEAPERHAQAWNFGPSEAGHVSVGEIVERFAAHWPLVRAPSKVAAAVHEATLLHLDCGKSRELLNWRPVWEVSTMLARTAVWYRSFHECAAIRTLDDLRLYVDQARDQRQSWACA